MRMRHLSLIVIAMLALAAMLGAQQDPRKRVSPPATAEATINGKAIKVDYSRPRIADPKTGEPRKIMGGLVPYGQRWRTGANEATQLTTEADLEIGGQRVPAGKYSLFTIPGEKEWTLIINRQTGQWGTEYDEKQDLARVKMEASKTGGTVEQFTISIEPRGSNQGVLKMAWENTQASVPFTVK